MGHGTLLGVIVPLSPYRCPFELETPAPPSADGPPFAGDAELVLTLGLFWLVSAIHVWSAMRVGGAVANGTFGSAESIVALFVTVALPVLAHKGLDVRASLGADARNALKQP